MIFPMEGPNGIGLSPDGSTLYVAETYSAHLWRFRLSAPGVIDRTAGMDAHGGTLVGRGGPGQFLDSLAVDSGGYICVARSEEHTSELQSLMRISYAVFCLKKKNNNNHTNRKQFSTLTISTMQLQKKKIHRNKQLYTKILSTLIEQ